MENYPVWIKIIAGVIVFAFVALGIAIAVVPDVLTMFDVFKKKRVQLTDNEVRDIEQEANIPETKSSNGIQTFIFPQNSKRVCPICGSRHAVLARYVPIVGVLISREADRNEDNSIIVHSGCIGNEPTPLYYHPYRKIIVRQAIY